VTATAIVLDPCFDSAGARAMVELCERFGSYRMYAEHEQHDTAIGRGLAQRHDALTNFLRSGTGTEPIDALAVRTSYFREEYAYGAQSRIDGIDAFVTHPAFIEAARAIHGRAVIEPAIAYANLMVPGQELAVHTDVPEFRGANRKLLPQWLLVVMHHSGLFEEFRMPIATAIAWFHDCDGGELAYWPDSVGAPPEKRRVAFNTAMVLDTDSVFHGVERIASVAPADLPRIRPGTTLDALGSGTWCVRAADGTELARYAWEELRFSVSWKAYCFRNEEERASWREHANDLTLDVILDALVDDLVARDACAPDVVRDAELGQLLIDTYIRFPARISP
jgi:hypothetical protein